MAHQVTFKFIYGDKAFFMKNNRVVEGKVVHLQAHVESDGVDIKITLEFKSSNKDKPTYMEKILINELDAFATKEELLSSL